MPRSLGMTRNGAPSGDTAPVRPQPISPDDLVLSPMRRTLILLFAVIAVLVVAHTLVWRWAVQRIEGEFANWVTAERAEGWTVTSGEPMRGGWPLAAQLTVPDLSITGGAADIPGGLAWSADRLVVGVALAHPRLLTMDVEGTQRLRFSVAPEVSGVADRFRVTIPLDPGTPPRAGNLSATNLRLGPPSDGLTIALLGGQAEVSPGAAKGEPAVTVSASAEEIALPPGAASEYPRAGRACGGVARWGRCVGDQAVRGRMGPARRDRPRNPGAG